MQKDEIYIRTPPIRKLNNGLAIQQKNNQLNKKSSIKFSDLSKEQPSNQKITYRRQSQPRKPVQRIQQAISIQRNLSQEPQTQGTFSVVFANSAPQKRDKRKVQTSNCDQIEETKNNQVRMVKGFYPSDINNIVNKIILTNILQGMQQRISAEKSFGVMGLQVVSFNKLMEQNTVLTQQTIRLKALSQDKERDKSQSYTEEIEKKIKCKVPQKIKQKHSINFNNNASPVPLKIMAPQSSSTQIQGNNFKFSLTEYSSLSREQLFQTKLQNYQHFLFLVSTQSGFYTIPQDCLIDLKFKIGKGNNSILIKEIFKLRWWWNQYKYSELIDSESNFIWTQIKVQNYMDTQNLSTNEIKSLMKKKINQPQPLIQIKKKIQIDHLLRLMNDDSDYKQIERNQKAYDIHNHIEKNYHLGNKKALYHNLKRYYELTKQDLYTIIPMTFHVQKGSRDKVYLQFLEHYKKLPKGSTWIVKPGEFTNRGSGILVCQNLSDINKIISKKQVHTNGKQFTYLIQRYY